MTPPDEVLRAMAEASCGNSSRAHAEARIRDALAAAEQAGWVLVPASEEYLIWSIQHGMWWRPGSKGYTLELAEAGRYSREEAIEISRGGDRWRPFHRPREVPVLVDDAAMLNADLRDDAESFEDDEEYEANEGDWTLGP